MDRRTQRGQVRRAFYRDLARLVADAKLAPPAEACDASLSALYWKERERMVEWLAMRGRGELVAPPGGVGAARS